MAKGRAWMAGGRWKGGKAAAGKILGGRRGVQGCDTCGLGLETEAAGGGDCECRGGVRVGGGGAVLHVGGPFPGAAGRDLGAVRRGAKPDFLPGPSAPPPSCAGACGSSERQPMCCRTRRSPLSTPIFLRCKAAGTGRIFPERRLRKNEAFRTPFDLPQIH